MTASAAPASQSKPAGSIRVFNTLSKRKEPFEPLVPGKVGVYLCGPTVYKPSHIGHMVGPVIFDAVKRFLVYSGYDVTLVVNITDVDDKLIAESKARGVTMAALAEEMTADYLRNLDAMGIDTIDHFPKATEHMADIIDLTQSLIDRGFAYAVDAGDVYFEVGKDSEYGKLSGRSVDAVMGAGGEMGEQKRSPADFALWKAAKPGEPSWESPWGPGRPGWHIECSAMSCKLLGETFDIHGGGLDLAFPHHENEIAQSECCHGKPLAKYWMHNGLMQASGEVGKVGGRNTRGAEAEPADQAAQEAGKMGKSKGASAFSDLLKRHAAETIRFFLLSTHYRRPIDFSEARIEEVAKGLDGFYRFFQRFERIAGESFYDLQPPATRAAGDFDAGKSALLGEAHQLRSKFLESMDDDFNTGGAVAALFDLKAALNRFVDSSKLESTRDAAATAELSAGCVVLKELAAVLGLFRQAPASDDAGEGDDLSDGLMQLILQLRAEARKAKDFATADRIRDGLKELGVIVEDRPDGATWSRA